MTGLTEQIGNITLNYKHYPGEDLYCDGDVEDELLDIVQNHRPEEFQTIIEERASWPVLYHLSSLRENIVDWLPMDKSMKVLEVGSGCGAITGALSRKAGSVTCIDLSKKRSHINAYRHKDCDNVTIHVGNFKDIEPELPSDFDYVLLIGVFEYGQGYMGTQTPYEDFMAILKKHLLPNGRMAIAIENKFGLKYWAGCKEDHLGTYFASIEDYPEGGGVRTFTRNGLEQILAANDIENYSFYYPYPDYKFMTSVYSDFYLPKVGELNTNIRNFDRDRMLLFDEKKGFDTIIKEGLFPLYSNSYMLIIGDEMEVKYSKYSNDRAEEFAIRTEVRVNEEGSPYVVKIPMSDEARSHVKRMVDAYHLLASRYEEGKLKWNRCSLEEDTLYFEYVNGFTLEEIFDELIAHEDYEAFYQLFEEYVKMIDFNNDIAITDFDLIFSNILIDGDSWTAIDYEWTFLRSIPVKEIAYRAFYCYLLGSKKREVIKEERILEILKMTEQEAREVRENEQDFQASVTGKRLPMGVIRDKIGCKVIKQEEIALSNVGGLEGKRIQVYEDTGSGYSETDSYFLRETPSENTMISLKVPSDVVNLRIDPSMEACLVTIKQVSWNGCEVTSKSIYGGGNGKKIADDTFAFATNDPNISFKINKLPKQEENELNIVMDVVRLPDSMAASLTKKRFG